jgi:hypothetical protein
VFRFSQYRRRAVEVPQLAQRFAQLDQQAETVPVTLGKQCRGSGKEIRRRPHVASCISPQSRSGKMPPGAVTKVGSQFVHGPQLKAVTVGSFEVVAENLVQLDQARAMFL